MNATTTTTATPNSTPSSIPSDKPTATDYLQYAQERSQNCNVFLVADEKMIRIKEIVEQIKDTAVPVLITGE